MGLTGKHTYVGFGFGPVQAGVFLHEAFRSGKFRRLVVAEVVPGIVEQVREAGGFYLLNIAHMDRIETVQVGPVEIYSASDSAGRERIAAALGDAQEIGTAIPSADFYSTGGPGSLHYILTGGLIRKVLRGGPRAVVYAAERKATSAESLETLVLGQVPLQYRERVRTNVQFLNTVINKMIGREGTEQLAATTPEGRRTFLVEAFSGILIPRVRFDRFDRGMVGFVEKIDLTPFSDVKRFGHEAAHTLAGYLGKMIGAGTMSELRPVPGLMPFVRDAFVLESGAALVRKHAVTDGLFTPAGLEAYADDLLERMTNPFLRETVDRVCQDSSEALGWEGPLVGTLRMALLQGVEPRRYALGAAAALGAMSADFAAGLAAAAGLVHGLWPAEGRSTGESEGVLAMIEEAARTLRDWRAAGLPDLREFFDEWNNR